MVSELEDPLQIRSELVFNFNSTPRYGFRSDEITTCYGASGENDNFCAATATSEISQVLLVSIYNMIYPITENELHQVFNPYGNIENIIITSITSYGLQALIHFHSFHCAVQAKNHLHGRNIYDGCCQLDIQYFRCGYMDDSSNLGHDDFPKCISEMMAMVEKMLTTVNSLQSKIERIQVLYAQKCESFNNFAKKCTFAKSKPNMTDLKSIKPSTTRLSTIENVTAETKEPKQKNSSFMEVKMSDEFKMFVEMIDKSFKPIEINFHLHDSKYSEILVDEINVNFSDNVLVLNNLCNDETYKEIVWWTKKMSLINQMFHEIQCKYLIARSMMIDGIANFFVFDPGGDNFDVDTWSALVKITTFEQ